MNEGDLEAFSKWKIDCTQIVLALRTLKFPPCLGLALNIPEQQNRGEAPVADIPAAVSN